MFPARRIDWDPLITGQSVCQSPGVHRPAYSGAGAGGDFLAPAPLSPAWLFNSLPHPPDRLIDGHHCCCLLGGTWTPGRILIV